MHGVFPLQPIKSPYRPLWTIFCTPWLPNFISAKIPLNVQFIFWKISQVSVEDKNKWTQLLPTCLPSSPPLYSGMSSFLLNFFPFYRLYFYRSFRFTTKLSRVCREFPCISYTSPTPIITASMTINTSHQCGTFVITDKPTLHIISPQTPQFTLLVLYILWV